MTRAEKASKRAQYRQAVAKLHAFRRRQADVMRELYYTQRFRQIDLARMWGLRHQCTVSKIISGQIWT